MGFLKNFFDDVFADERPSVVASPPTSSFDHLSDHDLEAHLKVSQYGDFELTDAVRPSFNLDVVPTAGFRHDVYKDEENRTDVPVIMASASREVLLDIFMELVDQLGQTVDVVLETSHGHRSGHHTDLYREHIDMPILQSTLWDFEDLLTNDGCTGVAVLNPRVAAGDSTRRAQAADRLRGRTLEQLSKSILLDHSLPCKEAHSLHHRSRTRALQQRALRGRVRRTQNATRHGRRVIAFVEAAS